ncbi:MAG: glycosyltransferase family 39 protein [Desulfobacterales bacterium]|nr:glycosyltransferase family 39 protein [Desulfobacterales bacterium]
MFSDTDKRDLRLALAVILAGTLFRLVYAGQFLLVPDETNYWQWSRYLAPGYHDQAPLIAWAIKVSTLLLGHTETAVRLPSVLALAIVSIYMVLMAGRWFGGRAALNTAVISQGIFAFMIGGLLATADGLQAMAWAGACYHVARGYEKHRWFDWLAGGLWFGMGMLSKYTMVLFLPSAYLYGLFSSVHRARLADIKPYVGVLLGCLLFTPVIVWNAQNNWNSVRHVAYIGGANEAFRIHWNFFGDYLGSQAALLTPLVFILCLMAWWAVIRKQKTADNWIARYLFFTSFTMFVGFALLSFHSRVYGNWPMACYITVGVLAAVLYGPGRRPDNQPVKSSRLWPWAVGTSYLMTAMVLLQVIWPFLPLPAHLDRAADEIQGWRKLGVKTGEMVSGMPDPVNTFIFGVKYQTASELAFYTPGNPHTVSINRWDRPNVYDYWWEDKDLIGKDAVGVTQNASSHLNQLNQVFERVASPVPVYIYRKALSGKPADGEAPFKVWYLYKAYGFKGGLRWIPPTAGDVRAG